MYGKILITHITLIRKHLFFDNCIVAIGGIVICILPGEIISGLECNANV